MKDEQRLLSLFSRLPEQEKLTLVAFAEFLAGRCVPEPTPVSRPEPSPRPERESVVAAIKRLSAAYHMLDRSKMLHETSGLMAQHLLHGRDAVEVINELEVLFESHYQKQFGEAD